MSAQIQERAYNFFSSMTVNSAAQGVAYAASIPQGLVSMEGCEEITKSLDTGVIALSDRVSYSVSSLFSGIGLAVCCIGLKRRAERIQGLEWKQKNNAESEKLSQALLFEGHRIRQNNPEVGERLEAEGLFLRAKSAVKNRFIAHKLFEQNAKFSLEIFSAVDLFFQFCSGLFYLVIACISPASSVLVGALTVGIFSAGIGIILGGCTLAWVGYRLHQNGQRREEVLQRLQELQPMEQEPELREVVDLERKRLNLELKELDMKRSSLLFASVLYFFYFVLSVLTLPLNVLVSGGAYVALGFTCMAILAATVGIAALKKFYVDRRYKAKFKQEKTALLQRIAGRSTTLQLSKKNEQAWIKFLSGEQSFKVLNQELLAAHIKNMPLISQLRLRATLSDI